MIRFLVEAARSQLNALLAGKEADKAKLGKHNARMLLMLDCLRGRNDSLTELFLLDALAQREPLAKLGGEPSGKDIVEVVSSIMAGTSARTQSALVEARADLTPQCLGDAFVAACRSRKPAEVFDLFSTYLQAKVDEKRKNRDIGYLKREAIIAVILQWRRGWHVQSNTDDDESFDLLAHLDPRWLDLAIALRHLDLIQTLAVPGHDKANEILAKTFVELLAKSKDGYELGAVLSAMIRVRHPQATDAVIAVINKRAKSAPSFGLYGISHLIPGLPKTEAVPKLEALLPTIPEKLVDQLLDCIAELKNAAE